MKGRKCLEQHFMKKKRTAMHDLQQIISKSLPRAGAPSAFRPAVKQNTQKLKPKKCVQHKIIFPPKFRTINSSCSSMDNCKPNCVVGRAEKLSEK
jgi:hypothetical protein